MLDYESDQVYTLRITSLGEGRRFLWLQNRVWYGVKVSAHPYYESPGGHKDISFERITRVERDTCALG